MVIGDTVVLKCEEFNILSATRMTINKVYVDTVECVWHDTYGQLHSRDISKDAVVKK